MHRKRCSTVRELEESANRGCASWAGHRHLSLGWIKKLDLVRTTPINQETRSAATLAAQQVPSTVPMWSAGSPPGLTRASVSTAS